MKKIPLFFSLILILLCSGCFPKKFSDASSASSPGGLVVSPHPVASKIGMEILKAGGNAIDAAVATGMALGVVDQFNSGIGGGGFILIRLADGMVYAIDGREKAPAAATRDMYVRNGNYRPDLGRKGTLAVGVPGILSAYEKALDLAGSRTLEELICPSVQVAAKGFTLDGYYLNRYRDAIEQLIEDPVSAKIYLHSNGSGLEEGDVFKQQDLALTYRKIAQGGADYFYRGEFAEILAAYMEENSGLITLEDMKNYTAMVREPIVGQYRQYLIYGMPPPSSGGIHLVQILNMLEFSGILDEASSWDRTALYWTSRFMSRAFEDRAEYLGDTDFYPVPVERLTSKAYAETLVLNLMRSPMELSSHPVGPGFLRTGYTANISVLDKWGNAVAVNQTVNLTYGAKITLPGTGVILNNEMDDFSARPGVPNAFGLVGSEANAIEPGKRPLSSMSPTIVVEDDRPVMILGGAGGPAIITAVLQIIVDVLDFKMSLSEAVAMPRFHHQFRPDTLVMEAHTPFFRRWGQRLKDQEVVLRDHLGVVHAIAWSEREKAYIGVADPRGRGGTASF